MHFQISLQNPCESSPQITACFIISVVYNMFKMCNQTVHPIYRWSSSLLFCIFILNAYPLFPKICYVLGLEIGKKNASTSGRQKKMAATVPVKLNQGHHFPPRCRAATATYRVAPKNSLLSVPHAFH